MLELFENVEKTQRIQRALKLLLDADKEEIDMLPPIYRRKAREIREKFRRDRNEQRP